jgi:hypothetical protein
MSHVSGITGVRHIIDGNTEYNGYSWPICGWTWNAIGGWISNSGLNPTVTSWAVAAEAKMSIDPAARANCTDFGIVFLRKGAPAGAGAVAGAGTSQSTGTTLLARRLIQGLWIQERGEEKVAPHAMIIVLDETHSRRKK